MSIPLKQYWTLLIDYLRPERPKVVLLGALLFANIGLQLLSPQIMRSFIDSALGGVPLETLVRFALLFIGVGLASQGFRVGATYVGQDVGWSTTNRLREDLARHCLGLDLTFYRDRPPGELIERIDGDVTALSNFFSQLVIQVLGSALLVVGTLILLFREDWRVGLVLSIFALLALTILNQARELAVPHQREERQASAQLFGFLEERLTGLEDIRANGAGHYAMRRFHERMRDLFRRGRKAILMRSVVWLLTMGLFAIGNALTLGMGAYLFLSGAISIGTVYLFFQYIQMLQGPLEEITDQLQDLQRAGASIQRIQELRAIQGQVKDGAGANLPAGALPVEFAKVSFAYADEAERPVLQNISFHLAPGRILGILGRTGSGKTTLSRLLFRFYDPTGGEILLGEDTRRTRLRDLRQRVALVTQDVQLFSASVRDNLTLFDRSIPDARILTVVEELGLPEWFANLPEGLDTRLDAGGAGLSAGEAQLLAFVRVFLRDPGLVILDEASSRLDPATERLIENAVGRLLRGRTGMIIAHRLATIQRADEILILEDGRIREHGPRLRLAGDPSSRFAQLLHAGMEEALA